MMENMQKAMMKRYKMFAWMGFVVVLIAFYYSLQASAANSLFFSASKAVREAAGTGDPLALANAARHVLPWWVPAFKFFGLGLLLGAITMALGLIATTLRNLGDHVMAKWPHALNPGLPPKPKSAKMFPMIMMMGWMVLLIGLVWAFATNGMVVGYWNNSVADALNLAPVGSTLLTTLGTIASTGQWLVFLRFLGMSLLFSAITVALSVIIRTLQNQENNLRDFVAASSP
jgi:hypothetical protein